MAYKIEHKVLNGFHVFTSPDLPGLYVAHPDEKTARESVEPTIKALEEIEASRRGEQHPAVA